MDVGVPPGGAAEALSQQLLDTHLPVSVINASWVQSYEATGWIRFLANWGDEFPDPTASADEWHGFVSGSLTLPSAIIFFGTIASLVVPLVLNCCHPKWRSDKGGPPFTTLAAMAALTLLCLLVTAIFAVWTNSTSYSLVAWQLNSIGADVDMAAKYSEALNESGIAVVADLAKLKTDCPASIRNFLGESVDSIVLDVEDYITRVADLRGSLADLPRYLDQLQAGMALLGRVLHWCLWLPCALGFVCCCTILLGVAVVEFSGSKLARRLETCELPCLSFGCVAPIMFLSTMVVAAEFFVGIASSSFCMVVDEAALRYAEASFGYDSDAFNLTRYYIEGNGVNPALLSLSQAEGRVVTAITWVRRYGDVISRACPNWDYEGSSILNLETVEMSMNDTGHLLAPGHVYPYYKATVHELVCGTVVPGITATALLQLFLAMICLPALICAASCTVDALVEERSSSFGIYESLAQDENDPETPLD